MGKFGYLATDGTLLQHRKTGRLHKRSGKFLRGGWLAILLLIALLTGGCGSRIFSQPAVTATLVATIELTRESARAVASPRTATNTPAATPTATFTARLTVAQLVATPTPLPALATPAVQTGDAEVTALPQVESPLSISAVMDDGSAVLDAASSPTSALSASLLITQLIQLTMPERVPLPGDISAPALNPDAETIPAIVEAISAVLEAPAESATSTSPFTATVVSTPETPTETPTTAPVLSGLPTVTPTLPPLPIPADEPTPTPTALVGQAATESTPDGVARSVNVPILMYHYLSLPPAGADIYRLDLSVTPELFAAQLDALRENGYTTITLDDMVDHLEQGAPLPEKPVVLTFDDGYRDNYENAFPLLAERGMKATFLVVTDFIDDQRPGYLTWEMAREMQAGGMSIESHGRNHTSLKGRDDDFLIWQALGSAETIQFELGRRPRFVSYPAGEYDQRTIDIFRSADYRAGATTIQGATHASDDLFQLRRVRVRGTTTPEELLRLLAVDW